MQQLGAARSPPRSGTGVMSSSVAVTRRGSPGGEAVRRHLPAQVLGGEVGARRQQPVGEGGQRRTKALLQQREERPRRLERPALGARRLRLRRPAVDVEVQVARARGDEAAQEQRRGDRARPCRPRARCRGRRCRARSAARRGPRTAAATAGRRPRADAAARSAASASSSVKNGGTSGPSATRAAPVSVARLTISSGASSSASASASASTSRPSASVLLTSTVSPLRLGRMSPGRIAGAGDRVLDRRHQQPQPQVEPEPHHHVGEAHRGGRAAHVLLHQPHRGRRLDVEPAGVEADALADQRHLRRVRAGPRRGRAAAAARWRRRPPPRSSAGSRARSAAAPRVTATSAPCRAAERHEGRLQRLGPHVAGRRVDQILRQRRRGGDPLDPRGVDALGADELGRGRLAGAVAVEAIVGEQPAERLERRRRARRPRRPARSARPAAWRRPRRAGSGRAGARPAVPQPTSAARSAPSGAGQAERPRRRRPRSPWPATQARVARVLAVRASPARPSGAITCSGIGPGVGRGGQRHARNLRAGAGRRL